MIEVNERQLRQLSKERPPGSGENLQHSAELLTIAPFSVWAPSLSSISPGYNIAITKPAHTLSWEPQPPPRDCH